LLNFGDRQCHAVIKSEIIFFLKKKKKRQKKAKRRPLERERKERRRLVGEPVDHVAAPSVVHQRLFGVLDIIQCC